MAGRVSVRWMSLVVAGERRYLRRSEYGSNCGRSSFNSSWQVKLVQGFNIRLYYTYFPSKRSILHENWTRETNFTKREIIDNSSLYLFKQGNRCDRILHSVIQYQALPTFFLFKIHIFKENFSETPSTCIF